METKNKKDLQEFIDKAEVFIEQQETKLNALREPPTYQKKYNVVEELKQQITEKDRAIENWRTMYESVTKTCNNDAKEIDKLNKIIVEQNGEHELLINQFEEETEKLRKQIKQESDARKRFVEEVKKLKQQLSESEKEIKEWVAVRDDKNKVINKQTEKINQLKQQIENLNNRMLISQLQAPKEQILNILGSQCIQHNPDQDKISFAVEKLEKVKNRIQEDFDYDDLMYWIDKQIKELKGEE